MYQQERMKAINQSRNQANKRLKKKHAEEWREYYIEECLSRGITLEEMNNTPSITIALLEKEIEQLKSKLKKTESLNA
jgi:hypothetical protein